MLVENPRDIEYCKQLLPFPGRSIEVVTVEKSQKNDFSIVSETPSSTLENDETNVVCNSIITCLYDMDIRTTSEEILEKRALKRL